MASVRHTLDENWVQISSGPATIQKMTRGFGAVMIAFGTSAPANMDTAFMLDVNPPHYFSTEDSIYAMTPHGVPVEIVVGD